MIAENRTPLVLVCGPTGPVDSVMDACAEPGTVLVHHDLSDVSVGVVRRTTTRVVDGAAREHTVDLGAAGCCLTCALREDLLPLLRSLAVDTSVQRIVVRLDRTLEAEAVCWAVENTVVAGMVGRVDAPASADVRIEAVVGCVDGATWLADATGDDLIGGEDDDLLDDRTVAQVAVGNVRFADVLVVADTAADAWESERLRAVLDRLAPTATAVWVGEHHHRLDVEAVLSLVPATARRGAEDDVHGPLLDGQPPLSSDCGVTLVEFTDRRPFHPGRLHDAIDVLLDGVVASRGRLWVATQPDEVLWIESAGGGLRVAGAGRWLAAMDPAEYDDVPTARRALAALGWDDDFGDRATSLVILVHRADVEHIHASLADALLTDDELRDTAAWSTWDDPFGQFHSDPCDDTAATPLDQTHERAAE